MKKKAELLQTALKMMKRQLKGGGIELPTGEVVVIDLDEARALVEALESLWWVNLYDNLKNQRILGNEHTAYNEAITIGFKRNSTDINYIETVGIIRLKSDEQ